MASVSMDMDAVTAHLDRGWDLLARGDLTAARLSAEQVLDLDAESAEGHTLLGAVASAAGEAEDALGCFERALEIDPECFEALLQAAEVAIHPIGDFDYAHKLCDEADELADSDEELLDVRLLRIEACLGSGQLEQAQRIADALPEPPYHEPSYDLRLGRVLLDLDRPEAAIPHLRRCLERAELEADARYFLGLACDRLGQVSEALTHLLRVRELEAHGASPSWTRSAEDLGALAREVVAQLPAPLGELLRDVPVEVARVPPSELVAEGFDPRASLLLCAVARDAKRHRQEQDEQRQVAPPQVTRVFIYQHNLERTAGCAELVPRELALALINEGADVLELDDDAWQALVEGLPDFSTTHAD